MAHDNTAYTGANDGIISAIQIPGANGTNKTYEIHDASAIHSLEDLDVAAIMHFKGKKDKKTDLPATGNELGDVWYVAEDDCEYVWADKNNDKVGDEWEALGNVHDAASVDHVHTVTVTGTNSASSVSGTVAIPAVTSNAVSIPNVTENAEITASKISANTEVAASKVDATSILASASVTNGVLSFGAAEVAEVKASKVTASDVKASKVSLGTAIDASKVTVQSTEVEFTGTAEAQTWNAGTVTVGEPVEE